MKMFKSRGGYTEKNMSTEMKNMDGYYGGEHKQKSSHKPIAGTPMPGHATSSMEKEQESHKLSEPGEKKYKSNMMSPGCKEGKINEYGK